MRGVRAWGCAGAIPTRVLRTDRAERAHGPPAPAHTPTLPPSLLSHSQTPSQPSTSLASSASKHRHTHSPLSPLADSIPALNIFGLQRLLQDLSGLGAAARAAGGEPLAAALAEPTLLCELVVLGG